jgi:hypothetical protein
MRFHSKKTHALGSEEVRLVYDTIKKGARTDVRVMSEKIDRLELT